MQCMPLVYIVVDVCIGVLGGGGGGGGMEFMWDICHIVASPLGNTYVSDATLRVALATSF